MWSLCLTVLLCLVSLSHQQLCPNVPADCQEPTGSDCAWYERCLNVRVPCGINSPNYAVDGFRLCDLPTDDLSSAGVEIAQSVRRCLQTSLVPLLEDA